MRFFIRLITVFIFLQSHAFADLSRWQYFAEDKVNKGEIYIDMHSLGIDNSIRTIWIKETFKIPKNGTSAIAMKDVYDCANNREWFTKIILYAENGEISGTAPGITAKDARPIAPNSITENIRNKLCQMK